LEVKSRIIKHFEELQANEQTKKKYSFTFPTDPAHLRIRALLGHRPGNVHPNSKYLKDILAKYQNPPEVIFSILPESQKEDKVTEDQIVLMLRQFHPDKYELGNVIEITANKDDKIGDIKLRIASIVGIPLERLTMATADTWDLQSILRLPKLNWYPRPEEDKKDRSKYADSLDPNRPLRSLMLDDGSILLYRDLSVARKMLTSAEERKISDEEEKKKMMKNRTTYHRKQENLDIKVADVSIDIPHKKT